jgi:hypothetical protein
MADRPSQTIYFVLGLLGLGIIGYVIYTFII